VAFGEPVARYPPRWNPRVDRGVWTGETAATNRRVRRRADPLTFVRVDPPAKPRFGKERRLKRCPYDPNAGSAAERLYDSEQSRHSTRARHRPHKPNVRRPAGAPPLGLPVGIGVLRHAVRTGPFHARIH
jgi:hypothetical protein